MKTALIALDGDGSKLIGVWVPGDDGKLDSAFRDSALQYQRADGIARGCPSSLSWDDYCDQLADRTPVHLWWESKQVEDNASAEDVLNEEVAKQFRTASE